MKRALRFALRKRQGMAKGNEQQWECLWDLEVFAWNWDQRVSQIWPKVLKQGNGASSRTTDNKTAREEGRRREKMEVESNQQVDPTKITPSVVNLGHPPINVDSQRKDPESWTDFPKTKKSEGQKAAKKAEATGSLRKALKKGAKKVPEKAEVQKSPKSCVKLPEKDLADQLNWDFPTWLHLLFLISFPPGYGIVDHNTYDTA
ncbi:hypothetical protein K438DRAFT_1937596 [Mycena galopus ATCC 62051]|nr:hypothetical protein K438DRAFT_1937596 [Mycena galopus ATCC 62051]